MSSLVTHEREKYQTAWAIEAYAKNSPGAQLVGMFRDMAGADGGTVLDAGCGSGKGALALHAAGFDVTMCDLTPDGVVPEAQELPFVATALWDALTPVAYMAHGRNVFDYVYCCDVLEHVPTPFTMLVVARLLDVAHCGVFLSISTVPDQFGSFVGEQLHRTVQPFVAWRDQLGTIGRVVEARDLLASACFYVVRP